MGTLYLVRHGQASFGQRNYDALSPLGEQQSRLLGEALRLRGVEPQLVFSGDMQRHRQTAAAALQAMGVATPLQEDSGLNEFDHQQVIAAAQPKWADATLMMAELAATADPRRAFAHFFKSAVQRWVAGEHEGDYGESWRDFKRRCVNSLERLAALTPSKGDAVVFTSGGVISVACAHLLGLADQDAFRINWTLANASITKIQLGRDGMHVISINEHGHLQAHADHLTYR